MELVPFGLAKQTQTADRVAKLCCINLTKQWQDMALGRLDTATGQTKKARGRERSRPFFTFLLCTNKQHLAKCCSAGARESRALTTYAT